MSASSSRATSSSTPRARGFPGFAGDVVPARARHGSCEWRPTAIVKVARRESHMEQERREDSTEMRARAVSMIRGSGIVTLALALALAAGVASAAEDTRNRTGTAHKIIVVDSELIRPAALMMSKDDVLEFENNSGHAMTLAFVEPRDQVDKIRCHPRSEEHTSE